MKKQPLTFTVKRLPFCAIAFLCFFTVDGLWTNQTIIIFNNAPETAYIKGFLALCKRFSKTLCLTFNQGVRGSNPRWITRYNA